MIGREDAAVAFAERLAEAALQATVTARIVSVHVERKIEPNLSEEDRQICENLRFLIAEQEILSGRLTACASDLLAALDAAVASGTSEVTVDHGDLILAPGRTAPTTTRKQLSPEAEALAAARPAVAELLARVEHALDVIGAARATFRLLRE